MLTFKSRLLAIALACSSFVLLSCDEEDDPLDLTAPELSIAGLTPDMEVWNTVALTLEATDDRGIDKIDLFVDGTIVTTITQAPFETTWDSNTVTDGPHTIKAVATDKAGNTVEREVTIQVKNVLVNINLAANHLYNAQGYTERGFVFLSDEDGKVITSVEYSNGQKLELKSPAFNGITYYLTEVLHRISPSDGERVIAVTYRGFQRGSKWVLISSEAEDDDDDATYVGEATLNYSNENNQLAYEISSNGDDAYAGGGIASSTVRVRKAPGKLYVLSRDQNTGVPSKYNLYSNIVTGPNSIDLGLVSKTLAKVTATPPPGADYVTVELAGYPIAGDYSESYNLSSFYGNGQASVDVYYPGAAFPSYYAEHYAESDSYYYSKYSRSEIGNFAFPQHTESISFANNRLTYSASGDYDFLAINMAGEDQEVEAFWAVIVPKGSAISIPVIELPSNVSTLNIPAFGAPTGYTIYDYEGVSDYDTFKTFVGNSTRSFLSELETVGKNYTVINFYDTPNGRKRTHSPMHGFGIGKHKHEKKNK